jgi:hypothetical protein
MGRFAAGVAAAMAVTAMFCAPSAGAEESGCERVPILGLNPQIREICDGPMQPGGWWARARQFSSPQFVRSSCDGVYYQGGQCPPWLERDVVPAQDGPVETYIVTADTIPPGEPGHLGP